jgi:two-component system, OmpR family, response regulator VanR
MANKNKILIAEDEKSLSNAMQLKLTHAGFEVVVVGNGMEVLEALKKDKFNLIVMDLIMPKMDGFATLQALQDQGNTTPIIVTSNLGQEEDIKRVKSLGAIDYLVKSNIPIADIVLQIEKALKTK